MDDLPERFGDYDLIRRLGVGGMAETFLAVQRGAAGFEQRVCIKRILATFQEEPEFVAMFRREARLSALLHHGNIARVLDFGIVGQAHYLALELIEGIDLRGVLDAQRNDGRTLEPQLVLYLARSLGSALEFAHTADDRGVAAGILHRDLSPSNVLLSYAGEIKLADFGIAKQTHRPGSLRSTALKGKVPYMAPEYALGRHYDARTDLFSLGVLLYECLAGRRPFDGENDLETLDNARHGRYEPIGSLAPATPEILSTAIEALLQPHPPDRTANATQLLDQIEPLQESPLCRRTLGQLVRGAADRAPMPLATGLASTRPALTPRPRKRRPSRNSNHPRRSGSAPREG
ncbi:MAG: serine/threonine-protein kinase [Myxococcota bacterium]